MKKNMFINKNKIQKIHNFCLFYMYLKCVAKWTFILRPFWHGVDLTGDTLKPLSLVLYLEEDVFTWGRFFTQIHHKIISFLLFWDVLWITNDLLAPDVLIFFMNFNKIVSFYGQYHYQTNPISVGSLTITNIPKYTLKFRLSKVWYI
jgi:hypothetical protein